MLKNKAKKYLIAFFIVLGIISFSFKKVNGQELRIIPRAEWGANESLRFNEKGEDKWPEEYAPVQKFIIHHSGTTLKDNDKNGAVDQEDYKATIRAIYNWHAQVLNWGDIGYNYLIDPLGNIYQGRYGSDGVVGGHALDDVKNIGYNRGSVGIVILGTYGGWVYEQEQGEYLKKPEQFPEIGGIQKIGQEEQHNGRWRVRVEGNISQAAKDSLSSLISSKSKKFNISPNGYSDFVDLINIPNIIGHRDVDRTTCPGENLYASLPEIRNLAQSKYGQSVKAANINRIFAASLQGQSDSEITLKPNETKEIYLEYKNEGNTTWETFGGDEVYLASIEKKEQMLGNKIASEPEIIKLTHSVAPGEKIKFNLTLKPPAAGTKIEKIYLLFWGNKAWLPSTEGKILMNVRRDNYAAAMSFSNLPEKIWAKDIIPGQIKFKNVGLKSWIVDKLKLKIFDSGYKSSLFKNFDWPDKDGSFKAISDLKEIKPDEEITFNFNLKAPTLPWLFKNIFKLEIEGVEKMVDAEAENFIQVEPDLKAGLTTHSFPHAMLNVWRPSVMLKFKNTGRKAWDKNLILKSFSSDNKTSPFYHSSWESSMIIEKLDGKVEPGQEVTFIFKLKAPSKANLYQHKFSLFQGNERVYINEKPELIFSTRVDSAQ
ncbi:MAG: N-acetylmuramoyl-L-alanine amidase family 2 protein [Parcubacteria group bacterium Athens1014_10]|nr:MAG: N-acetylmuramoyl-L-alanine amidase family 2 protein [Parcubacteria group bacterium Athens1014_10]